MAHTSLTDVRGGLTDAQDTDMFDFVIPDIPGGSVAAGRDLAVVCQTAVYPGRSNEIMETPLHGTVVHFSGRAMMPRTMSVTYAERHDMFVTNLFQEWFEFQRGTVSGTAAAYKADYTVDGAVLIKYDVTGRVADQVTFFGLQPESMEDVTMDGSSTNLFVTSITFRYDFYTTRNIQQR
jgi:hypothetical protein